MIGFPRKGIKPGRTAQPRSQHVPQGQKLGRKRMRRGFPEAPSGAGQVPAYRANRTGFRREGLRGAAGPEGNMFGGGSSDFFSGRRYRKNG